MQFDRIPPSPSLITAVTRPYPQKYNDTRTRLALVCHTNSCLQRDPPTSTDTVALRQSIFIIIYIYYQYLSRCFLYFPHKYNVFSCCLENTVS